MRIYKKFLMLFPILLSSCSSKTSNDIKEERIKELIEKTDSFISNYYINHEDDYPKFSIVDNKFYYQDKVTTLLTFDDGKLEYIKERLDASFVYCPHTQICSMNGVYKEEINFSFDFTLIPAFPPHSHLDNIISLDEDESDENRIHQRIIDGLKNEKRLQRFTFNYVFKFGFTAAINR